MRLRRRPARRPSVKSEPASPIEEVDAVVGALAAALHELSTEHLERVAEAASGDERPWLTPLLRDYLDVYRHGKF